MHIIHRILNSQLWWTGKLSYPTPWLFQFFVYLLALFWSLNKTQCTNRICRLFIFLKEGLFFDIGSIDSICRRFANCFLKVLKSRDWKCCHCKSAKRKCSQEVKVEKQIKMRWSTKGCFTAPFVFSNMMFFAFFKLSRKYICYMIQVMWYFIFTWKSMIFPERDNAEGYIHFKPICSTLNCNQTEMKSELT